MSFLELSAYVLGDWEPGLLMLPVWVRMSSRLGRAVRGGGKLLPLLHMNQTLLLGEAVASSTEDDHSPGHFELRKESPSRIELCKMLPIGTSI